MALPLLQSGGGGASGGSGTVTSVTFTGDGTVLSSTPSSAVTTSGTLTAALATQTANKVLAGPTSGGAVNPTFRALVAADLASGIVTWDNIGSAGAALTLSNAGNATTFNQTSAVTWTWANTTIATVSTTNASPIHSLNANYWTGAASAVDSWTISSSLAAGSNAVSKLTIGHSGSTGTPQISLAGTASTTVPSLLLCGDTTVGLGLYAAGGLAALIARNDFRWYNHTDNKIAVALGTMNNGASSYIVSGTTNLPLLVGGSSGITNPYTANSAFLTLGGNTVAFQGVTVSGTQTNVTEPSTFSPASGSSAYVAHNINPTINQTGTASGAYTALKIAAVETALLGSGNKLIDCFAGSTGVTEVFSVDNAGISTQFTPNGAQYVYGSASELLTLSTVGLTTTTVGNLLPANSIIDAVVCRVTTTITTTTNWAVGDATTTSRFSSANATLTAGTTSVGLNAMQGVVTTTAAGPTQAAAAKVQITCTGSNPGAGVIRITVFYRQFVAPTS